MIGEIAEAIRTLIAGLPFMDKHAGVVRTAAFVVEDPNVANRWIRKSYPIACNVTKDECLTGQWRDLVPNTLYKSVSYFEDGGVRFLNKEGNLLQFRASLDWVCWLNLPKLGVTTCSISSAIIASVIAAIPEQPFNSGNLTRIKVRPVGEKIKSAAIFSKYTYDETLLQYLLGPFDYFCLQFEVDFVIDKRCISNYSFQDPIECETQDSTDPVDPPVPSTFCEKVMACSDIIALVEAVEEIENNYISCASLANCSTFTELVGRVEELEESGGGGGDMFRTVYDSNLNGVVDNSERLGGQLPAYYATASDLSGAYAAAAQAQSDIDAHKIDVSNPHAVTKSQVGLSNVDNTADINKPLSNDTISALALKESLSNKNQANGYVGLDSSALIPAIYLPSYVDDVLEFANLASFPVVGESGKIYTALDTEKIYRWSGTIYVEISSSPGSSDEVVEGVVNLYWSQVRFDSAFNSAAPTYLASWINSLADKSLPVNADSFAINDSEASNIAKKLTFTNLKSFLKTYFDSIYRLASTLINLTSDVTGILPVANGGVNQGSWIDYSGTSTIVGWGSFTIKGVSYQQLAPKTWVVMIQIVGTSDSTVTSVSLPFTLQGAFSQIVRVSNNGGAIVSGQVRGTSGSNVIVYDPGLSTGAAWTASGTKTLGAHTFIMQST